MILYINSILDVDNNFNIRYQGWRFYIDTIRGMYWVDRPWGWVAKIPLWIPTLVLSIWPAICAIQFIRAGHSPGHCPACNYDLRGTPSGVCPECGEEITKDVAGNVGG